MGFQSGLTKKAGKREREKEKEKERERKKEREKEKETEKEKEKEKEQSLCVNADIQQLCTLTFKIQGLKV